MFYYFLLLFTSLLWAGSITAGKFVVGHATPIILTDLRWGLAVILLIPLVWWKEKKLLPPLRALPLLILMGATGMALYNVFMFLALERTTADNTALISALNPLSIALVSFIVLRERLTALQVAAMMLSLFGVLIVISHGDWHKLRSFHFNPGDLFMLFAVLMWGLYAVAGRFSLRYVSPMMSTLWSGIFGLLLLAPVSITQLEIHNPTPVFWASNLYGGIAGTVLAMVFWNIGVQKVGATRSGIFLNFNPIFTAVLAYFLLGEHVNTFQWIGSAVVIGGVLLFTATRISPRNPVSAMAKETSVRVIND